MTFRDFASFLARPALRRDPLSRCQSIADLRERAKPFLPGEYSTSWKAGPATRRRCAETGGSGRRGGHQSPGYIAQVHNDPAAWQAL